MFLYRLVALAALVVMAAGTEASAQFAGLPTRQSSPCEAYFPIQKEAQDGMSALHNATERKAPREEFCKLFSKLSGTTGRIVKFFEQNKTLCGVPNEAVQRAKADHNKILGYRKQACAQGPGPSGPSLSDVLGAPVLPDSSANKSDGIFNTMTGNPLTR
jgi:hypothetical protein